MSEKKTQKSAVPKLPDNLCDECEKFFNNGGISISRCSVTGERPSKDVKTCTFFDRK